VGLVTLLFVGASVWLLLGIAFVALCVAATRAEDAYARGVERPRRALPAPLTARSRGRAGRHPQARLAGRWPTAY
jgi:hypothetical protein